MNQSNATCNNNTNGTPDSVAATSTRTNLLHIEQRSRVQGTAFTWVTLHPQLSQLRCLPRFSPHSPTCRLRISRAALPCQAVPGKFGGKTAEITKRWTHWHPLRQPQPRHEDTLNLNGVPSYTRRVAMARRQQAQALTHLGSRRGLVARRCDSEGSAYLTPQRFLAGATPGTVGVKGGGKPRDTHTAEQITARRYLLHQHITHCPASSHRRTETAGFTPLATTPTKATPDPHTNTSTHHPHHTPTAATT